MSEKNYFIVFIVFIPVFIFSFTQTHAQVSADSSLVYGSLVFKFNVDTAFVQFGRSNPEIRKIASGDTIRLRRAFYHMYLSYPTNADVYVSENIFKDSLFVIEHNFDLSQDNIELRSRNASIRYLIGGDLVLMSDFNTEITSGNETLGLEIGVINLKNNPTQITLMNPDYENVILDRSKRESVIFEKYFFNQQKKKFYVLNYIPSVSQFKRGEEIKGGIMSGLLISSMALFVYYNFDYRSYKSDFSSIRTAYVESDSEILARQFGNEMTALGSKMSNINTKRNIALAGIIGAYGYDLFDKWRHKKTLPKETSFDVFLAPNFEQYLSIGARLKL